MARMSKRVEARLHNARHVISSVEQHAETIAAALAENIDGVDVQSARAQLQTLVDHLAGESATLRALEQAYVDEQADDPPALAARDEASQALYDTLQRLRAFTRENAPRRLRPLGLSDLPPARPDALLEYARDAARLLARADAPIDSPLGLSLDLATPAAQLEAQSATLAGALDVVRREGRELEQALIARDRQLEVWTRTYRAVGSVLVGLYQLAGYDELADRIRPSARKARGEERAGEDAASSPTTQAPGATAPLADALPR